jgi:hypothetical protein
MRADSNGIVSIPRCMQRKYFSIVSRLYRALIPGTYVYVHSATPTRTRGQSQGALPRWAGLAKGGGATPSGLSFL